MRLDFTLVHLSPLVNSYKGRDYFSAFVFYSANLKDLTNLTKHASYTRVYHPDESTRHCRQAARTPFDAAIL